MSSTISKLPPEMLGKIFIHSLPCIDAVLEAAKSIISNDDWHSNSTMPVRKGERLIPFTLSAVCRSWNEVALGTPRLWSFVIIDAEQGAAGVQAIETWIQRSGSSPLTFILATIRQLQRFPPLFHRYLRAIVAHVNRWEHVYIAFNLPKLGPGAWIRSWGVLRSYPISSAPLLRSAYVCIMGDQRDEGHLVVPLRYSLIDLSISPGTTRLRHILLKAPIYNPISHPTFSATSLSMTNIAIHNLSTLTAVALLSSCPNIQDLALSIRENSDEVLQVSAPPYPAASLTHLLHLDIGCDADTSLETVLSSLDAPALTYLKIGIHSDSWSDEVLRDAFTAFLFRSGCHLSSLALHLGIRLIDSADLDECPLPVEEDYWTSLRKFEISGAYTPELVDFHSSLPVLEDMALQIPLCRPHYGDTHLPNIRRLTVTPNLSFVDDTARSKYRLFPHIVVPSLLEFRLMWPLPCLMLIFQHWSAVDHILRSTENLSHLSFILGRWDPPEQLTYVTDSLYFLLRVTKINSALRTLIFCGCGITISHNVIALLRCFSSADSTQMELPNLRNLVLCGVVDSNDGSLANMVASRFEHSRLEFFYIHFYTSEVHPILSESTPDTPTQNSEHQPELHLEDERRLLEMKLAGRDVTVDRGKDWDSLCEIVRGFDKRFRK